MGVGLKQRLGWGLRCDEDGAEKEVIGETKPSGSMRLELCLLLSSLAPGVCVFVCTMFQ